MPERRFDWLKLFVTACWVSLIALFVREEIEEAEEKRRACDAALDIRYEDEQIELNAFRRLGQEFEAPSERVDRFISNIEADYDALPPPAACR